MEKIKVLIVAGHMDVGGIENQLMHLLRNADKEKFQIDFTSTKPDAYYKNEIEALGGKYLYLPTKSKDNPLKYARDIYRVMKDGKYDIVHSHELFHTGMTLFIAKLAGVKHRFAHAHNWQEGNDPSKGYSKKRLAYHKLMRFLINRYSTVQIACSTLAGKFLYGEKTLKKPSYHLVYNSVDTTKFLERYNDIESGEFCDEWTNVINVGRYTEVKNQLFLTEVAKELKGRKAKIRILCAGKGDEEYVNAVKQSIQKNDLDDYMKLIGVRSDIDVLMRKSKVFVLPSRYEGMPLVLIEAQASGLPCVIADTFSHEVDFGLNLIEWLDINDSADKWADALIQAVDKPRAEKTAVVEAVNKYGFDSRCFAETLCRLYEEACA